LVRVLYPVVTHTHNTIEHQVTEGDYGYSRQDLLILVGESYYSGKIRIPSLK